MVCILVVMASHLGKQIPVRGDLLKEKCRVSLMYVRSRRFSNLGEGIFRDVFDLKNV